MEKKLREGEMYSPSRVITIEGVVSLKKDGPSGKPICRCTSNEILELEKEEIFLRRMLPTAETQVLIRTKITQPEKDMMEALKARQRELCSKVGLKPIGALMDVSAATMKTVLRQNSIELIHINDAHREVYPNDIEENFQMPVNTDGNGGDFSIFSDDAAEEQCAEEQTEEDDEESHPTGILLVDEDYISAQGSASSEYEDSAEPEDGEGAEEAEDDEEGEYAEEADGQEPEMEAYYEQDNHGVDGNVWQVDSGTYEPIPNAWAQLPSDQSDEEQDDDAMEEEYENVSDPQSDPEVETHDPTLFEYGSIYQYNHIQQYYYVQGDNDNNEPHFDGDVDEEADEEEHEYEEYDGEAANQAENDEEYENSDVEMDG